MRRFPLLPAAVLCAVVLVQRCLVYRHGLTPWMGAGFSMFTSIDDPFARHVRCTALAEDGRELAVTVPALEGDPSAIVNLPTSARLAPLARELAVRRCDAAPDVAALATRVRVEVWSLRFGREAAAVTPWRVAGVTADVQKGEP